MFLVHACTYRDTNRVTAQDDSVAEIQAREI